MCFCKSKSKVTTQTSGSYSGYKEHAVCSTVASLQLFQRPKELPESSNSNEVLGSHEQQNSSSGFSCTQQEKKKPTAKGQTKGLQQNP